MKAFLVFLILVGAAWKLYTDYGHSIPGMPWTANLRESYSEIEDIHGRVLSCKLLARDQDYLMIEREADGQSFLIRLYDLSDKSRRRIESQGNFNQDLVEKQLFSLAKERLRVELQYVPELNYFRCGLTGKRQESCRGQRVDEFRAFLTEQGIEYRETTLPTRPAGEHSVYLPDGVRTVPCVQIGDERLYALSESKLKEMMTAAYMIEDSYSK